MAASLLKTPFFRPCLNCCDQILDLTLLITDKKKTFADFVDISAAHYSLSGEKAS